MPVIKCPHEGCAYETGDVETILVVELLKIHALCHMRQPEATPPPTSRPAQQNAKLEQVKRPVVKSEGTAEEWQYFLHRWEEYTMATNITGPDRVQQLLECCDPDLRLGISRQAGTSMARHTEIQALEAIKLLAVRAENIEVATDALLAM